MDVRFMYNCNPYNDLLLELLEVKFLIKLLGNINLSFIVLSLYGLNNGIQLVVIVCQKNNAIGFSCLNFAYSHG